MEKIIELKLTANEKQEFKKSTNAVRKLTNLAEKLL